MTTLAKAPARLTLWLAATQLPLGTAIVEALRASQWDGALRVGSTLAGEATGLAAALSASSAGDDLRSALAASEAGVFFLGSPGAFASLPDAAQRLADVALLENARKRGVTVTSLEPLPASLIELLEVQVDSSAPAGIANPPGVGVLGGMGGLAGVEGRSVMAGQGRGGSLDSDRLPSWVAQAGLARWSASVKAALDVAEQLGPVRSMSVESIGPAWAGSLGARIADAMDLAMLFLGEAESVDAAFDAPSEGGLRPTSGNTLRDLRGDLTANLRFSGGRSATVYGSSEAGQPRVRATLMTSKGRVSVGSGGFEWVNVDGSVVESPAVGASPPDSLAHFAGAIADQLLRLDSAGAEHDMRCGASAGNAATMLAMAQAALLSCRTGEAESPATMLKMAGG